VTSPGMIRIGDPARIGTAVEAIRTMLGLSRRDLARALATRTGRSPEAWNSQLWSWERDRSPNPASLSPVLAELGYQLAIVPIDTREDA
jgi:transcriptional regulator with XRE-family HTH domain